MRSMTKFYFGFVASFLLSQVFGLVEAETAIVPTSDHLAHIINNNNQFKACSQKLDALKDQIEDLKITMKSEHATVSSKITFIDGNLENHTNIQMNLNYKLPDLKAWITTITTKQEKLDIGLNSSMAIQKKLESKEKLLPTRTAAKSVEDHLIRTSRIAFFAQRNTGYNTLNSIIPYQINVLNFGEAFNVTKGIFQVPVKGVYHFYFTALKMKREISGTGCLTVQLKKIGNPEVVLAESHVNSNDWYGWFPLAIQATISLDKDSLIGVKLTEGSIYQSSDESHPLTSFGGFLVSPAN